jgi:hypothetical protein
MWRPSRGFPTADGRVAEVFITSHKAAAWQMFAARDAAIAASIAVQYGAPLEMLRRALCYDSRGRASGPLGAALDLTDDAEKAR